MGRKKTFNVSQKSLLPVGFKKVIYKILKTVDKTNVKVEVFKIVILI